MTKRKTFDIIYPLGYITSTSKKHTHIYKKIPTPYNMITITQIPIPYLDLNLLQRIANRKRRRSLALELVDRHALGDLNEGESAGEGDVEDR